MSDENRIRRFFRPIEPKAPEPPPLDKLLADCGEIKLRLSRWTDDGGVSDQHLSFEIHGDVGEADGATLAALLAQFRTPRGEAGAA